MKTWAHLTQNKIRKMSWKRKHRQKDAWMFKKTKEVREKAFKEEQMWERLYRIPVYSILITVLNSWTLHAMCSKLMWRQSWDWSRILALHNGQWSERRSPLMLVFGKSRVIVSPETPAVWVSWTAMELWDRSWDGVSVTFATAESVAFAHIRSVASDSSGQWHQIRPISMSCQPGFLQPRERSGIFRKGLQPSAAVLAKCPGTRSPIPAARPRCFFVKVEACSPQQNILN